jgi:hypothetical protein
MHSYSRLLGIRSELRSVFTVQQKLFLTVQLNWCLPAMCVCVCLFVCVCETLHNGQSPEVGNCKCDMLLSENYRSDLPSLFM